MRATVTDDVARLFAFAPRLAALKSSSAFPQYEAFQSIGRSVPRHPSLSPKCLASATSLTANPRASGIAWRTCHPVCQWVRNPCKRCCCRHCGGIVIDRQSTFPTKCTRSDCSRKADLSAIPGVFADGSWGREKRELTPHSVQTAMNRVPSLWFWPRNRSCFESCGFHRIFTRALNYTLKMVKIASYVPPDGATKPTTPSGLQVGELPVERQLSLGRFSIVYLDLGPTGKSGGHQRISSQQPGACAPRARLHHWWFSGTSRLSLWPEVFFEEGRALANCRIPMWCA